MDKDDFQRLLDLAKSGDADALGKLLDQERVRLEKKLAKDCRNNASAEDIVGDALLKAMQKIEQFRGQTQAEFHGWFLTNVCRKLYEHNERRKRRPTVPLGTDAPVDGMTSPSRRIVREEAWKMLDKLPQMQRDAVLLRLQGSLSFAEIAAKLGVSVSWAHGSYHDGIQQMSRWIEQ